MCQTFVVGNGLLLQRADVGDDVHDVARSVIAGLPPLGGMFDASGVSRVTGRATDLDESQATARRSVP